MKVPIPKEAVAQIMNDYNCSEEQAAKAYLDARDRANEGFKSLLEERFGPTKSSADELVPKVYTPRDIKGYLDKFVIGQEEYKKRLAIAAAYHFAMIKHLREHPEDGQVKRIRRFNSQSIQT